MSVESNQSEQRPAVAVHRLVRKLAFITPDSRIAEWVPDPDSKTRIVGHWYEDNSTYYIDAGHEALRDALILLQNNLHTLLAAADALSCASEPEQPGAAAFNVPTAGGKGMTTPSEAIPPLAAPPCSASLDVADCCISLDEARDVIRRRERYADELITWMNERRNAPDATTLGMIQERLRLLCSKPNATMSCTAPKEKP